MTLSAGSRSFTRYGYADLLREDRQYTVRHRVLPGTQRLLLWGDPASAAAYSRAFQFCGIDRRRPHGAADLQRAPRTGVAGQSRCGYADASLAPRWDWQKYAYWYRVWGRLMYNPDADPDVWRRAAWPVGRHGNRRWPAPAAFCPSSPRRICPRRRATPTGRRSTWNHSLVAAARADPYTDTPAPRTFGNVSPLDPQLFSRIDDFAGELLKGERSGKYSPIEVAQWLEDFADSAEKQLAVAGAQESAEYPAGGDRRGSADWAGPFLRRQVP